MASHLLVHYHRIEHDYQTWSLAVFPNSPCSSVSTTYITYRQARCNALTSFGAVFWIDLSLLPPTQHLLLLPFRVNIGQPDAPARLLDPKILRTSEGLKQVFITEASPEVQLSPTAFSISSDHHRFLFFSLLELSDPAPVLNLYLKSNHNDADNRPRPPFELATIFPATFAYRSLQSPLLFMFDLLAIQHDIIFPVLVPQPFSCIPAPPCPTKDHCASLTNPPSAFHYRLIWKPREQPVTSLSIVESSHTHTDITEIIRAQPQVQPALSAHSRVTTILPSSLLDTLFCVRSDFPPGILQAPSTNLLTVYCRVPRDANSSRFHFDCKPLSSNASVRVVRVLPKTNRCAYVVEIDISSLSASERSGGLILTCGAATLTWSSNLGYHVTLSPCFPRLVTPNEVHIRVYYHRFGDFEDWSRWHLRLSSVAADGISSQSIVIQPHRLHCPGVVFFHTDVMCFPYDASIRLELFRTILSSVDSENTLSVNVDAKAELLNLDRYDIVRTLRNDLSLSEIHFIQGDPVAHIKPPSHIGLNSQRYVRFRYRRFLPNDYRSWDLWTWDDTGPMGSGVSVLPNPGKTDNAWVDFVVDRANYGTAKRIFLLPRRGGAKWTERDDPIRLWSVDTLYKENRDDERRKDHIEEIPLFIIAQGTHVVVQDLAEIRNMLDAYVESESSIILHTPVPIAWVSPPTSNRPKAVAETIVKFCNASAVDLHEGNSGLSAIEGKVLRFTKTFEKSWTEVRLIFTYKEVEFVEDFLVERVVVSVPGFNSVVLHWRRQTDWDKYLYKGSLGWEYHEDRCLFRCFAPTADLVSVVLYKSASGMTGRTVLPMRRIPEGCWKATVKQNLKGRYYTLLAEGVNKRLFPGIEVIDPYSRCNTAHNGRGLIFGTEDTKIFQRPDINPCNAIIYELHIRDITIDDESGISHRGKFQGLAERGTHLKGEETLNTANLRPKCQQDSMPGVISAFEKLDMCSTGLDHVAQMGVTAIQILPIQDFDNDESDEVSYRWGYMPVHFNSPDGWYASSTVDETRVKEFKLLVDAIHRAGMKVIMDVVYNHTAEDSNELNLDARFSFNGLAPRYYYRTCGNTPISYTGHSTCGRRPLGEEHCGECYSNGSGCGNEFRSESPMGRKFIIDSLKYWATEFSVDGFRFDLLGLIDIDTLTLAAAELRKIDNNIMLYGEPWAGGLSPIQLTEKGMQRSRGFGVFNDTFRNAIRGSPFESEETFVMDGGRLDETKGGIVGSIDNFCDTPAETINYVECHDNYTLWDHFQFYVRSRSDNIIFSENDLRRMHRLAAVLVITSQGVPFIQAGQEMCRTKFDVENSYESPDEVNMIRWRNKIKEWSTICYYRGLIVLRRTHPEIFAKKTAEEIHDSLVFYEDMGMSVPDRCIAYRIKGDSSQYFENLKREYCRDPIDKLKEESRRWSEVIVLLNPTPSRTYFELPDSKFDSIWFQVVNATQSGVRDIAGPLVGTVAVEGRSAAILRRASMNELCNAQLLLRLDTISDSYCCFHGDNMLSRYAVGLDRQPSSRDIAENARLQRERELFEEYRNSRC